MLRNLVVLAILGCVFAAEDVNRCEWGESYWCSSLRIASACGGVNHCMSTVWAHTQLKQDSNETCQFCENIISDVRKFITSQETEAEIKQFLDSACSVIPDPDLSKMCQDTIDNDLQELFEMIKSELDPQVICAAMGLCSGLEDLVKHPVSVEAIDPIDQMQQAVLSDECGECKLVMTELKAVLTDTTTQQDVENFLNTELCAELGGLSDTCKGLVAAYVPQIMKMLAQDVDPATVCAEFGFCNATRGLLKKFLNTPNQGKQEVLRQSGPKMDVSASTECVLCEFVMTQLDGMLGDNKTEHEIIAALDKVCSLLPSSISSDCDNFVNTYGPAVLILLKQELDPTQICGLLGLCSSKYVDLVELDTCSGCVTVMNYVDSLLGEKPTQQDIEKVLDKVCNFLPDSYRTECTDLVNQYTPMLITLILKEATPQEICTAIKLCTSVEKPIIPTKAKILGESECTWGPSYWCASRENAKECRAEAHCEKHVWKTK